MDPAKMKVVDLRSELGALGLDTKGNKPALVERLKKALEAKTGKVIADTTILDTSTEDADEPATPRRAGPAARTRRRSSSTRAASTPAKVVRVETPEPIAEEPKAEEPEPQPEVEPEPESAPEPVKEPEPEPVQPQPVPAPEPEPEEPAKPEVEPQTQPDSEMYSIDDDKSQSPVPVVKTDEEPMEQEPESGKSAEEEEKKTEGDDKEGEEKKDRGDERKRELTEEEEWEQLNERLQQKEKERIEREKKQAEEDAKRMEELSKDPVKLHRLKRKQEKKARWSNFYKAVAITNEVLTPPVEEPIERKSKKQEAADAKITEPDIDDDKLTLSWYDSDLHQYVELPELVSVVPLSDGAFAHAWAGARATHAHPGHARVCYEVRVGSIVTTTETTAEKEVISSGLRVGWSTADSSLHLGEGELSFGYENTGRAVNNGEFKEYGKTFTEKDVIGVYLDLESEPCTISYTLNGAELGAAHSFPRAALAGRPLFPHVLTKNTCYRVNFGDDQYNMLTKTKIVRKRLEIPVEQVLEEKRLREEEIQRQKDEAAKKEKERREREKKEREERQRKKREEREKQERERKEKEAQERKEKAEEVSDKPAADEGEGDKDAEKADEPKENGDKPESNQTSEDTTEVKPEPMETDSEPAKEAENQEEEKKNEEEKEEAQSADMKEEVKEEPATEGEIPEVTEEQVLKGLTLDKRIKFVIRFTVEQELDGPEASLLPGYVLLARAGPLAPGPRRPARLADCEVILMVGLPGAGKTHWVRNHVAAHPERRYNVLSTTALFHNMQVDCKPFRDTCEGRWDAMLSKGAKCVLKLLEYAHGRRRNYILDQRRKLREFEGYRRVAVAVVPDTDTYAERAAKRENNDGKEVPDGAIMDMKANFALPEKSSWIDEVIYPELNEEEAKKVVEAFHKEAKAAGVVREREKRDRSATRDAPPHKRARSGDRRHPRDDRRKDFSRDREDRWGGGGGGGNSRWGGGGGGRGGGGGGGGRWGGRDARPPPGRFDRPWGARDNGGPPFNRDRDGFRGGRGGGGMPGAPGGPGGPGGARGERGGGRPDTRFGRAPERGARPPPQDKRPGPPPQGGAGAGAGSWQRGGGAGGRGAPAGRGHAPPAQRAPPHKDGQQGQQQGQQQGWNQWANSGWGGWGNWNQNQAAWNNWGNWGNWNNAQQGQQGAAGAKGQVQGQGQGQQGQGQQATQQQWQQWYQWQQWQQQQGWPGYQQGGNQQQAGQAGTQDQQAQWAQYYQNYGAAANNAVADKK